MQLWVNLIKEISINHNFRHFSPLGSEFHVSEWIGRVCKVLIQIWHLCWFSIVVSFNIPKRWELRILVQTTEVTRVKLIWGVVIQLLCWYKICFFLWFFIECCFLFIVVYPFMRDISLRVEVVSMPCSRFCWRYSMVTMDTTAPYSNNIL